MIDCLMRGEVDSGWRLLGKTHMKKALVQRVYTHRGKRAGAAIVEVAVCFPVFMLILLGIIEFGRAMSINQMLNSAARLGCRAAILDGSTNSDVTELVRQHVVSTVGCQQDSVTVTMVITSSQTGNALTDVSSATTSDLIDIDVAVPFADVSWTVKQWLAAASIRGECSMQHE